MDGTNLVLRFYGTGHTVALHAHKVCEVLRCEGGSDIPRVDEHVFFHVPLSLS
jgi:hypothetical protein